MSTVPSVDPTFKEFVRLCATGNIANLASPGNIDGIALAAGDRVLLPNQTTLSQNGIYYWTGATLTRSSDASILNLLTPGHSVFVSEGATLAKSEWACTTTGLISPGSTAIRYTRISPALVWGAARFPWAPAGEIVSTLPRNEINSANAVTLTSGTSYLNGGVVLPAGIAITSINVIPATAGATYTVKWFSLVRQSDRARLRSTANSTTVLTANAVNTIALSSAYTPDYDTPVWIEFGIAATTVPQFYGYTATGIGPAMLIAPAVCGNSTASITSTPPADATTATAITVGGTGICYAFLT